SSGPDAVLPSNYTTQDTALTLKAGDIVQTSDGKRYEFVGTARGPPSINLANESFTTSDWLQIDSITAKGTVTVSAEGSATIVANANLTATAKTTNDGGVSLVTGLLQAMLTDYRYKTKSGSRLVHNGDLVRLDDAYAGGGSAKSVYRYIGNDAPIALGAANYADPLNWAKVTLGDDLKTLAALNINLSNSAATGV